jgi:hypothetical protein
VVVVVMVEAPMREAWTAGMARVEDRDDRAADAAAEAGHPHTAATDGAAGESAATEAAAAAAAAETTATAETAGVGRLRGKHRHRKRSCRSESEDRFA